MRMTRSAIINLLASPYIEMAVAHTLAREVTLDGRDSFTGKLHATELAEITLGTLEKRHGINIRLDHQGTGVRVRLDVGHEVADQDLTGQCGFDHARQFCHDLVVDHAGIVRVDADAGVDVRIPNRQVDTGA